MRTISAVRFRFYVGAEIDELHKDLTGWKDSQFFNL
jgi:hypothetical protein